MKKILCIALITLTATVLYAERLITFTDSNGVEQIHVLADDTIIATRRPDGSAEAGIFYEDGRLSALQNFRPDGSVGG